MPQINYSGSTEDMLQVLADHIGTLSARITVLEDRSRAHYGALGMIGGALKLADTEVHHAVVEMITSLRDFHMDTENYMKGMPDDPELQHRAERVAAELGAILKIISDPESPRFSVVDGGKTD